MNDRIGADVVVEDLARPLHACHGQRLRLYLIAPVLVLADPSLLLPKERHRDRRGERGEQHRHDDRCAAKCGERRVAA